MQTEESVCHLLCRSTEKEDTTSTNDSLGCDVFVSEPDVLTVSRVLELALFDDAKLDISKVATK
jgi:hypothetical protein